MERNGVSNYTDPPTPLPQAAIPFAMGSFVLNQYAVMATDMIDRHPQPMPMQNPCARRSCQNSEQMLCISVPKTTSSDPAPRRYR